MPRDYRRVPAPRSGGSGGVSSARAGSAAGDLNDALLKGSAATRNPDPFTAEVRAAYAAFAGITEEITARRLWRDFVTWDDVSDYTEAGVRLDDYATMIALKKAGVGPGTWAAWRTHLPNMYPAPLLEQLKKLQPLGVDPQTYGMWMELTERSTPAAPLSRHRHTHSYTEVLNSLRRACQLQALTALDSETAERATAPDNVIVGEALALTLARGVPLPVPAGGVLPTTAWATALVEGMSPVRAAALIYAGILTPDDGKEWADRSVRTILTFAALTTTIPDKVLVLAADMDSSPAVA